MQQIPTRLDGPVLIEPKVFGDERGFFAETFRANVLAEQFGITEPFVQDNHSRSGRGVVRGLHFHIGDGCSKLVRCGRGAIFDVAVDLRLGSPTYGEWEGVELTEENMRMFYVPGRLRPRLLRALRGRRRLLQAVRLLLGRGRARHLLPRPAGRRRLAPPRGRADLERT